ncbi:uncharacterized protein C3orf22 homolog isoform X4 [Monodelphis domestica]|uniref:uncharacterized protein C3orf22 homolog isoform X4 n=1 Tax=Monodelphis domestica TaxID=13616 RepID=UPI0007B3FCC3|nr:uncharacterized protein C3orf22 homolog isoform X4 [Monodelphis domestica]XP_016280005.1 uncharacterized protein C3orf22 homolog isoform X4 [Monodelphis domestica]XP_016280006.1 uncharacterized protein C3orf22 homolog isoform X4 [Monodelphis domestica]XP_016280007.1 uncharacterized protein C3orf22 homolog isoform X4 [Monodelphis domestica]
MSLLNSRRGHPNQEKYRHWKSDQKMMEAEHQRSEFGGRSLSQQAGGLKERVTSFDFKEDQFKDLTDQHENCRRPTTVPQYPGIQGHGSCTSFYLQGSQKTINTHCKSKKEYLEDFALHFPYRLAWLSSSPTMSRTRPWDPQKMMGHLRDKLPLQKSLQPTRSIPSKGVSLSTGKNINLIEE